LTTSTPLNKTTTRISTAFEIAASEHRAAFVAYLTAGDPTPAHTAGLVLAMARGGADLIELGVPFSDPIADGPVIQRGAERALGAGTSVAKVLDIAREIRKTSEIPLLLFTYLNPVLRYGLDALARDAAAAGIDGCLLTDVSVEEAETYVHAMRATDSIPYSLRHPPARSAAGNWSPNSLPASSTSFRVPA